MEKVNAPLLRLCSMLALCVVAGCANGPWGTAETAEREVCRPGETPAGSPLKICQSGGDVTVYSHRMDADRDDADFYNAVARELDLAAIPTAAVPALKVADHQVSGCSLGQLDPSASVSADESDAGAGRFSMLCTLAVTLTLE